MTWARNRYCRGIIKRKTLLLSDDLVRKGLVGDLLPRMENILAELAGTGTSDEEELNDILALAAANMGGDEKIWNHITELSPGDEVEIKLSPGDEVEIKLSSSPPAPPRFAEYLAILTANTEQAEAFLGDLDEHFEADFGRFGPDRAARRYWGRVLRSVWPLLRSSIVRMIKWGAILTTVKRLFVD